MVAIPLNYSISGFVGIDNPRRFCNRLTLLRTIAYIIGAELKEEYLKKANTLKMRSYPVRLENEVRINFFGGLEIIGYHGAISDTQIKSDRACRLIAYLYFNQKKFVSSQNLVDVLWSESLDFSNPMQNLRQLVYRTRKTLNPLFDEQFITFVDYGYGFNKKYTITSDIADFENFVYLGDTNNDFVTKLKYYRMALELYQNSFMPQHEEMHWILTQATYLHTVFNDVIKKCYNLLLSKDMYLEIYRLISFALKFDKTDPELNFFF